MQVWKRRAGVLEWTVTIVRIHPAIMPHTLEDCLKLSKYKAWENVFCEVPLSVMLWSPCWSILT